MKRGHISAINHRRKRLGSDPLSLEAVMTYAQALTDSAPKLPDGSPKLPEAVRAYLDAVGAWAQGRRDALVLSCIELVWKCVSDAWSRIQYCNLDRDDAFQEGMGGLTHAADLFDLRRGYQFTTYATPWIFQAIGRACDKHSIIGVPSRRSTRYDEEANAARSVLSLAILSREDGDYEPGEGLVADRRRDHVEEADSRADIAGLLRVLPARERRVIMLRYVEGLGLEEIGRRVRGEKGKPLCKERVRQLEKRALKRMRVALSG